MEKQRTLVIFRDCHKRNNIVIPIEDSYEERFYRNFARRMGWQWCIRKEKVGGLTSPCPPQEGENNWRKPAAIVERPRPKLFGAFNLTLTASTMEGGER